jgi:hypothetical protein
MFNTPWVLNTPCIGLVGIVAAQFLAAVKRRLESL